VFRYLARRFTWAVAMFLVITVVTYVIFFIVPVDPAKQACGQRATPTCIRNAKVYLGLDKPIHHQYARFLKRLVVDQDLGRSFVDRQSVNKTIMQAAPVTASIAVGGMVIMLAIAFPIGILSALRPRSLLDRAAMTFSLSFISVPSFWLSLVAVYLISFKLGLTPITGYCDLVDASTGCGGVTDWAWHLALPWAVFGVHNAAYYVRMIRAQLMEAMSEDYVRTARAKGAPEHQVIRSHAMRNAIMPIVTMLGMDVGFVLGGLFFLEFVFSMPGLGKLAIDSITQFDYPVTMGVVIFGTVAVLVANLLVDLLYAWIDPRVRLA
jgi:peptide/nickel transport system permease protein